MQWYSPVVEAAQVEKKIIKCFVIFVYPTWKLKIKLHEFLSPSGFNFVF